MTIAVKIGSGLVAGGEAPHIPDLSTLIMIVLQEYPFGIFGAL